MFIVNWLKKPWLHFIVLGFVLFRAQAALFPEPLPTVGPLSEARIEGLQQQWFSTTGRPPTDEQLARMVRSELDRDMLFQEALSYDLHLYDTVVYQRLLRNMQFLQMGEGLSEQERYEQALEMRLQLGDEVIKRRMVQVMEQLLLAGNPPAAPTEAMIEEAYEQRRDELRRPKRYSIEHLYFSRDREAEVEQVIATITDEGISVEQARQLGSPFLPGYRFQRQSPDQLARHFGAAFVNNLEQAEPVAQAWVGPVRSTYGLHYVWVDAIEPEREATIDEVRVQLLRDLESQARREALQASIDQLRENYEVIGG